MNTVIVTQSLEPLAVVEVKGALVAVFHSGREFHQFARRTPAGSFYGRGHSMALVLFKKTEFRKDLATGYYLMCANPETEAQVRELLRAVSPDPVKHLVRELGLH